MLLFSKIQHINKIKLRSVFDKFSLVSVLFACSFFFESGRPELAHCLLHLLRPGRGRALLFAPRRSRTLDAFLDALVSVSNASRSSQFQLQSQCKSQSRASATADSMDSFQACDSDADSPLPAVHLCRTHSLYALDSLTDFGSCSASCSTSYSPSTPPPPSHSPVNSSGTGSDDDIAQVPGEARDSASPSRERTSNCTSDCTYNVSQERLLLAPNFNAMQVTATATLPKECCLQSLNSTPTSKPYSLASESSEVCSRRSSQCSPSAPSALRVCVYSQYDERISRMECERRALPLYDPDIHSPILVLISPEPFAHSSA